MEALETLRQATVVVVTATPHLAAPTPTPPTGSGPFTIPDQFISPILATLIGGGFYLFRTVVRLDAQMTFLADRFYGFYDGLVEQARNAPLRNNPVTVDERALHAKGPQQWSDEELEHMIGVYRREWREATDPGYKAQMAVDLSLAESERRARGRTVPLWKRLIGGWS